MRCGFWGVVVVAWSTLSSPVGAEPSLHRTSHADLGVGVYAAATGSADYGSVLELELYPGGPLGRFGVRLEARGLGRLTPDIIAAGVAYEAGASRPRLVLTVSAVAGATLESPRPVVSGGGAARLAIVGPLALSVAGTSALVVDGVDSALVLAVSAGVRVGW